MKRKRNRSITQIFTMTIIEKMRHQKYEGDDNNEVMTRVKMSKAMISNWINTTRG